MVTLHLLGTGAALSDSGRTTTMLAVQGPDSLYLVDCGGDAAHRALNSGLDLSRVDGLIVTHEHADHVGGFPLLMERLWLAGHTEPFPIYGNSAALNQIQRLDGAFDTSAWPNYPALDLYQVPELEREHVLSTADFSIYASPGKHAVPCIGLRVETGRGQVIAYSGDTEPSAAITRLAEGADILVHEATGAGDGHTGPADAARIALEAGAKRLILVHLGPMEDGGAAALAEAQAVFPATELGFDGARYDLGPKA